MKPLKVVIADDEALSRNGLRQYVPWESIGLELVGCAQNGREALDMIKEHDAQLVITDIKMPQMDGLELIQTLYEQKIKTVAIIISAYDEFEYVQKAIRYELVMDYILKPLVIQDLCEKIAGAYEKWKALYVGRELTGILQCKSAQPEREELFNKQLQKLLQAIRQGAAEEAVSLAERLPLEPEQSDPELKNVKRLALELSTQLERMISTMGIDRSIYGEYDDGDLIVSITTLSSVDEIRALCVAVVNNSLDILARRSGGDRSLIVRTCLKIMREQYMDPDFSLSVLSDMVKASSNYISARLKMETGSSFIRAMNQIRMEKAKELLGDATCKVYEVCDRVGIRDSRYFTRVFKEYTGMTPLEYRKTL